MHTFSDDEPNMITDAATNNSQVFECRIDGMGARSGALVRLRATCSHDGETGVRSSSTPLASRSEDASRGPGIWVERPKNPKLGHDIPVEPPTPEQLQAAGPSVVAIAVALIAAVVQWRTKKAEDVRSAAQREADDKRLAAQREADNTRLKEQRDADAMRMRTQIEAEADKLVAEHHRQLDLRHLQRRDTLAQDNADRLRSAAAQFVSVFGEAQSVVIAATQALSDAADRGRDQSARDEALIHWTSDLQARLGTATAMMKVVGSKRAGEHADAARESLRVCDSQDHLPVRRSFRQLPRRSSRP